MFQNYKLNTNKLMPFLVGNITGALISPYFNKPNYPPYYQPYYPVYNYPPYKPYNNWY